jgi:hypothetical protein
MEEKRGEVRRSEEKRGDGGEEWRWRRREEIEEKRGDRGEERR